MGHIPEFKCRSVVQGFINLPVPIAAACRVTSLFTAAVQNCKLPGKGRVSRVTHLLVFIQEHPELAHADALVPIIKAVGDVPAQGPKLAPLLDQSMEEGQTQQQILEGHRLAAALKELQAG